MRTRAGAYLLAASLFAVIHGRAAAQVPTKVLQESSHSPYCQKDEEQIAAQSVVCLKVDRQEVVAGSSKPVRMIVTVYSPRESSIKLARVSLAGYEPKDGPITFEPPELLESGQEGVAGKKVYNEFFTLTDSAEPRIYNVALRFVYEDKNKSETIPEGIFRMLVGGNDALVLAKREDVSATTGETAKFALDVKNSYRGYPVHLTRIKVTSDSDLVRDTAVDVSPPESVSGKEVARVPVSFDVRGTELRDWIFGLSDATIKFELDYKDDLGRQFKSLDPAANSIKMTFKPGVLALTVGILLGVLMGTWVREWMMSRLRKGRITRKEQLFFITGTAVLGVITAVVAYFGQVKISVFTLNGSYDNPKVLFLIGFAATVVGPALIGLALGDDASKKREGGGGGGQQQQTQQGGQEHANN